VLSSLLGKTDAAGYEVCRFGNRLARMLEKEAGCTVTALNPGDLRIIWKSRKKTDREDALKIAKYLRDTPEEERCSVPLPGGDEEAFRSDISMKEYLKKERNGAINLMHALYGHAGIIDVTKKDLIDAEGRAGRHGELPEELGGQADLLEEQLVQKQLEGMREQVAERVRGNELAPCVMGIPGIGIEALPAYLGDGSRFRSPAQAASYAGLAPRVDCSGMTERYGSIAKYQFCHPIRGIVLEGVWALVRSGKGPLLQKYEELSGRMNKRKSAVAAARKMVSLAWLLMKRKEYYRGVGSTALEKKLRYYKIRR
jgi:transposase